ncbi:hypothetical protein J6590_014694 [Homalodisca vitripennis]|nr:hypothetical protein J6590_014694 [Homalodisca vitripennis]
MTTVEYGWGESTCPRCGKLYSRSSNMRRHLKLECGQERQHPCPYCPHRSKRRNHLKTHIQLRHVKDGFNNCVNNVVNGLL